MKTDEYQYMNINLVATKTSNIPKFAEKVVYNKSGSSENARLFNAILTKTFLFHRQFC